MSFPAITCTLFPTCTMDTKCIAELMAGGLPSKIFNVTSLSGLIDRVFRVDS